MATAKTTLTAVPQQTDPFVAALIAAAPPLQASAVQELRQIYAQRPQAEPAQRPTDRRAA